MIVNEIFKFFLSTNNLVCVPIRNEKEFVHFSGHKQVENTN